jgi:TctA family transporter
MDFSRALSQVAEIHQQIAKGEVYRGYRSLPVAASGVIGYAAAALQSPALAAHDPVGFVLYWAAVAACAGFVGASEIVYNYAVRDEAGERRRTRQVVGQFLPSMLAGALISACFMRLDTTLIPLLPGLWAICFGIGTFASRPYLPRASGAVALFYYAAGVALLWVAGGSRTLSGWWVGGTFGTGQLMAAAVLYWNLERTTSGTEANIPRTLDGAVVQRSRHTPETAVDRKAAGSPPRSS